MSTIRRTSFVSLTVALGLAAATLAAPGRLHAATCPPVPSSLPAVGFSAPPQDGGLGMREEPGRLVYLSAGTLRVDIDVPTFAFISPVRAGGAIVPPPNPDQQGLTAEIIQGPVGPGCQMRLSVVLRLANRGQGRSTPISIQVNGLEGGATTVDFTLVEVAAIDRNARFMLSDFTLTNRLVTALRTRFLGVERVGRIYNPYFNVDLQINEGHAHLTAQMKYDIPNRVDQTVTVSGGFHFSHDGFVVWDSGAPSVGIEYWPDGLPAFNYGQLRDEVRGFVAQVLTPQLQAAVRDELGAAFSFPLLQQVEMHDGEVEVVLGALTSYSIRVPYDPSRLDLASFGVMLPAFDTYVAVATGTAMVRQNGTFGDFFFMVDPHGLPNLNATVPGFDGGLPGDVLAGRDGFFNGLAKQNRDPSTLPLQDNDPGALIAQVEGNFTRSVLASPCSLGAAGPSPRRVAFAVNDAPGRSADSYEVTLVKWPFGGKACPTPHPVMFGGNRTKWMWVWGALGFLGDALDVQHWEPDGRGVGQQFANGELMWTGTTGSMALLSEIRARWNQANRGASAVGYPTSDPWLNPDGVGTAQRFEEGAIYHHPNVGAFMVLRGIFNKYWELGQQASFLGYPTTDELYDSIGGAFSDFQNGAIVWGPGDGQGSRAMGVAIRDRWRAEGAAPGRLGYPISDEAPVPGFADWRSVKFDRGTIFLHPAFGTIVQ